MLPRSKIISQGVVRYEMQNKIQRFTNGSRQSIPLAEYRKGACNTHARPDRRTHTILDPSRLSHSQSWIVYPSFGMFISPFHRGFFIYHYVPIRFGLQPTSIYINPYQPISTYINLKIISHYTLDPSLRMAVIPRTPGRP